MFFRLLLLFTLVPIAELFLILQVGQIIGVWYTVLIIFLTGIVGVWLARTQGFFILSKVRADLAQGQLPGDQLIDGLFVLAGSLLLLTPGLLTDTAGFIFLIPATRAPLREFAKRKLRNAISSGNVNLIFRRY